MIWYLTLIFLLFHIFSFEVSKKLDQLKNADRQSRHTFDVLDFYIDWFHEIREGILQSEKPSVDIELLKAQLKQQRALNEEIANERAGLRNVVVDATRIARDLNSTLMNQDGGLVNKIEVSVSGKTVCQEKEKKI